MARLALGLLAGALLQPVAAGEGASPTCAARQTPGDSACDPHLVPDPNCELGALFACLQPLALLLACLAVVAKKRWLQGWTGRPEERNVVLVLDVAKQAFSGAAVQIAAGVAARSLAAETDDATDECAWFSVVFMVDTTVGTIVAYTLLRVIYRPALSGRYSTATSGVSCGAWANQMAQWVVATLAARVAVYLLVLLFKEYLQVTASTVAQAFACRPKNMQWFIGVSCSVVLNAVMLCIQDSLLMDRRPPRKPLAEAQDRGLGQGLLMSAAGAAAGVAADDENEGEEDEARPAKTMSYVKKQKACMQGCCGCLILSVFVSIAAVFALKVHDGQRVFDPCYIQIRADPGDYKDGFEEQAHPNCSIMDAVINPLDPDQTQTFKHLVEHRRDLVDITGADWKPKCKCCNAKTPTNWSQSCVPRTGSEAMDCSGLGTCCARSSLHHPQLDLIKNCEACQVYKPCDDQRCPARPDNIRNSQHYPMLLGVLLSFLGNCHVIYSYLFDKSLRQRTITTLLACAAAVELIYCVCFMLQELSFRIPNDPCVLNDNSVTADKSSMDLNGDGYLDYLDCPKQVSDIYGWPTWADVKTAHHKKDADGRRGEAVNWCQSMSFMFQLTWTASDSYYFMITVDLLLNLVTSPFGGTRARWIFYQCWTWGVSITFAVLLLVTGDWGTSFDSLLEDFCWNINFGHKKDDPSSYPYLTGSSGIVYLLSVSYYVVALFVSLFSYWKLRSLTQGQREVREATIREGGMVAVVCAVWWLCGFVVLYNLVLEQTETIQKGVPGPGDDCVKYSAGACLAPLDYPNLSHRAWVAGWAFVVGGRNVITFIVWRLVMWKFKSGNDQQNNPQELNKILQNELLFFTGLGIRAAVRHAINQPQDFGDETSIELDAAGTYERENGTPFYRSFQEVFLEGHDEEDFPPELLQQLGEFKFKSYQTRKFAELRALFDNEGPLPTRLFGAEAEAAAAAAAAAAAGGGPDGEYGLLHAAMEHYEASDFSGGASGAFMYFSNDKRYIVKQMSHEEHTLLLKMLPEYHAYMEHNPKSLLLRVVQCNRVQMYQGCAKVPVVGKCLMGRLHFMVFENISIGALEETMDELHGERCPPAHRHGTNQTGDETEGELRKRASKALKESMLQYDLKGSWVNRTTITKGPPAQSGAVGTLKDGDLHEHLYLPKDVRTEFIGQLEKDTAFLAKWNIMDYSLLLGVKRQLMPLQGGEQRQARDHTYVPNQGRAAASYHIGVIDILQQWNWKKQMERTAKALLGKDIEGLSAIDAESFQTRFMGAMESHFPALDLEEERDGEVEEDLFETTSAGPSGGASPGLRISGGAGGGGSRLRLSSGTLGGSGRRLVSPTSSNETG